MDVINFQEFDSIINGKLRPHLPAYDNEEKIKILLAEAESFSVLKSDGVPIFMKMDGTVLDDVNLEGLGLKEGDQIEFEITDEKIKDGKLRLYVKNVSEENLEELIDLSLAPPPDLKAEYFLLLIEREYNRQITRIELFFKECDDQEKLKFFAHKKIQLLKRLASQAHVYQKQLHKKDIDDTSNPNAYVLYVVKEHIIWALMEIQNLFKPFLSSHYQTEHQLRTELYEYSRLLSQEKEFRQYKRDREINNFNEAKEFINKALFQLEMYMDGKTEKLEFFKIDFGFKRFREELVKIDHYKPYNVDLFCKYWCILRDLYSRFENKDYKAGLNTEGLIFKTMIGAVAHLVSDLKPHLDADVIAKVDKGANSIMTIIRPYDSLAAFFAPTDAKPKQEEKVQPRVTTDEYFEYINLALQSDRINDLCDSLKKHKFIHSDTKLSHFKKIFSGKPISNPVIWIGTTTELKYLFKLLYTDKKKLKNVRGSHWKIACYYFVDEKSEQFDFKKLKDLKLPHPDRVDLLLKMVIKL